MGWQLSSTTAVFVGCFHSRLSKVYKYTEGVARRIATRNAEIESRVRGGPALFITKLMKGTEVPNPRRSSACNCTCVLTRNRSPSRDSLMLAMRIVLFLPMQSSLTSF